MRENIAKKRLYAGETLYGIFANAISPELIEIMGITGFDFIVVDSEHSSSGPETNRILNMAERACLHVFRINWILPF